MEKCECYIHSLKQGETHVLGEATIIKKLGNNDYLAEYNGTKVRYKARCAGGVRLPRCVAGGVGGVCGQDYYRSE